MNLTLTRAHKKLNVMLGMLSIDNAEHAPLYTLELPWQDNKRQISCIPPGTYQVSTHVSPKVGKCWQIADVPDREDILIHTGNNVSDIEGCILLGLVSAPVNDVPTVSRSRDAIAYFRTLVGEHLFTLTIV